MVTKNKKKVFRVYKFSTFFVTFFCFLFRETKSALYKEINANKHHLWNDDDDENDEYFTPFETKKTKRDYYSHYDYFDEQ